jgi:hypothetical protein
MGLRARGSCRALSLTLLTLALALSAIVSHAAFSPQQARAASRNVLIVSQPGLPEDYAGAGVASDLNMSGYTTTVTESVPTQASQLAGYSQIWYLGAWHAIAAEDQERLEQYVRGGGSLYLTGKYRGTEVNESDQAIARSVLTEQSILVGQSEIYEETPLLFNKNAADAISNTPNDLSAFPATSPGGITGIGPLDGRNVLGSNGRTAAAAVFDERDMAGGRGRLVIYMDLGWQNPEYREAFENIANFLENAPPREEPIEKPTEEPTEKPSEEPTLPGNVLVLTSEAPANLQAGLDTTAVLRSMEYQVTLSVAPSIGLAKTRRAKLVKARRAANLGKLKEWKMPKLKDYSAVWMLAEGSPAAQGENRQALARYVANGGRLYLGGNHVTYPSHEADQDILGALLTDKQITIHDSIEGGSMSFAPQAVDGVTQHPTQLGEMPIHNTAEISGLAPRNVLATHGEVDTAAAFEEADMNTRKGRLVVYPDDWTQVEPDATTRNAFVEDIQDFLEGTPKRIPERSGEYVALGDSYAAGVGSYEYDFLTTGKNGCYRALHGFVEQIAEADHMSLRFVACKGAQINDVWAGSRGSTGQIGEVGADTRAITLTIGGNDVGFAGIIKTCMKPKIHFSIPGENGKALRVEGCHGSLEGPSKTALEWLFSGRHAGKYTRPGGDPSSNEQYQPSLTQLYESILYQAPGAELVVNGYPLLLETGRAPGDYVSCDVAPPLPLSIRASDMPWMAQEGEEVNAVIKTSVEAARANTHRQIRFADPRRVFTTHGLCDTGKSWINTVAIEPETPMPEGKLELQNLLEPRVESFHPTKEGQNALFNLVEETAQEF